MAPDPLYPVVEKAFQRFLNLGRSFPQKTPRLGAWAKKTTANSLKKCFADNPAARALLSQLLRYLDRYAADQVLRLPPPTLISATGEAEEKYRASDHELTPRKRIKAFIESMNDAGHTITRKNIWRVAGYNDATEFQRFQREDDRVTSGSAVKFNRVLKMSPEVFMEALAKRSSR